ncbi:DMT family transporter [Shimia sp. MMG029]|uniref:DMT family transporter n=1 Tax=Shimia sp. MMG029 TaxID=3021978 RepID=UPI0022FF0EE4|nr:DMT family transporter [Shimia sp. MMG029]MDA5556151.1 DMT family transporter [Shimia sp. MMG029]
MKPLHFTAILLAVGTGWGLTQPLTKIAVSEGYQPLGLIFWQLLIGALVLFLLRLCTGKSIALPRDKLWFFLLIAALGTLIPNSFSYRAAAELPSGVMSIVISLVPIVAFPMALLFRVDRFGWGRLAGLIAGLGGVMILSEPEALPDPAMALWLPIAVIAPICYALEGNVVSKWGMHGLGAGQVLYGACVIGAVLALPLALATDQFIDPRTHWNAPEFALVLGSLIHVCVYTAYVWLVSRAGAVFAAQVAYVVTGTGVLWAMILLSERYSLWVWAALALILLGMTLVRPRTQQTD